MISKGIDQGFARLRLTCPANHTVGMARIHTKDDPRLLVRHLGEDLWTVYDRDQLPSVFMFRCARCENAGEHRVQSSRMIEALLAIVENPTRGVSTLIVGR